MNEVGTIKPLSTAELAEMAFHAHEHVKQLEMMNTPTDFEDRKRAFIELALAREEAFKVQCALDDATGRRSA